MKKETPMQQKSPWFLFWNSLNDDEKRLFRLLQRSHNELGKNVQMFYCDYLGTKHMIEEYVLERFGIELNKLPRE